MWKPPEEPNLSPEQIERRARARAKYGTGETPRVKVAPRQQHSLAGRLLTGLVVVGALGGLFWFGNNASQKRDAEVKAYVDSVAAARADTTK